MAFGVVPKLQHWVLAKYNWSPRMRSLLTHPAGPFTIHFWCPMVKWGIVIANISDLNIPPENISTGQQIAVTGTGFVWARYCTQIIPKNWNLLLVNFFMGCTGFYQLLRKWTAK